MRMLPSITSMFMIQSERNVDHDRYAFEEQCLALYDHTVMHAIGELYRWLPYCSVINNKVFVVHAGLTMYEDLTLREIEEYVFFGDAFNRLGCTSVSML